MSNNILYSPINFNQDKNMNNNFTVADEYADPNTMNMRTKKSFKFLKRGEGKRGAFGYKNKNNDKLDTSKEEKNNKIRNKNNYRNRSSSSEKSANSHKSITSEQSLAKKYNSAADIFRVDANKLNNDLNKIHKNSPPDNKKRIHINYDSDSDFDNYNNNKNHSGYSNDNADNNSNDWNDDEPFNNSDYENNKNININDENDLHDIDSPETSNVVKKFFHNKEKFNKIKEKKDKMLKNTKINNE